MIRYSAYGLSIESDIPLPELCLSNSNVDHPDVRVVSKELVAGEAPDNRLYYRPSGADRVIILWPGLGLLEALGGQTLNYLPPATDTPRLVWRLFLACQGLGVILQQRGQLVLHASAVAHEGKVALFIGTHGAGKSTMAAAACASGWQLLSDDVTTVTPVAPGFLVQPAFGSMRIKRAIRSHFSLDAPVEGELIEGTHKVLCNMSSRFQTQPLPLGRIYVLNNHPELEILAPPPLEQFFHLTAHTYGNALTKYLGKSETHFQQCSTLVRSGMVRILRRPLQMSAIPDVLAAVARDLVG